jgi:hypothetical protein
LFKIATKTKMNYSVFPQGIAGPLAGRNGIAFLVQPQQLQQYRPQPLQQYQPQPQQYQPQVSITNIINITNITNNGNLTQPSGKQPYIPPPKPQQFVLKPGVGIIPK